METISSIIEGLVAYFNECPAVITLGTTAYVDILLEKGKSFSIEPVAVDPVVSNYIGGGGERQYVFNIAIKFNYSDETRMNLQNSGFFEELEKWLEEKNRKGELPTLPEDKHAESLEVISNGYLFGVTQDMRYGRYQLQCRLLYEIG